MKKQLLTFLALIISGIIFAQVGIGTTDPKSGLDINTSLGYKVTVTLYPKLVLISKPL